MVLRSRSGAAFGFSTTSFWRRVIKREIRAEQRSPVALWMQSSQSWLCMTTWSRSSLSLRRLARSGRRIDCSGSSMIRQSARQAASARACSVENPSSIIRSSVALRRFGIVGFRSC